MNILVMSYMRMHVCACMCTVQHTQGTDSVKGVIQHNSFEGVLRMDHVEGVHVCACMCTVQGSLGQEIVFLLQFYIRIMI